MKVILGVVMIALGIVFGAYVGLWLMLAGGILGLVDVVNQLIEGSGLDGMLIVISVLKIMFAGLIGYVSAIVGILPGIAILNKN